MPSPAGRRALALLVAVASAACHDPTLPKDDALPFLLMEKGTHQSLYGPDRRLLRLLHDSNRDGVADSILVYGDQGELRFAEVDGNFDGIVDRWEHYQHGVLVGSTYDHDGDGRPDSTRPRQ